MLQVVGIKQARNMLARIERGEGDGADRPDQAHPRRHRPDPGHRIGGRGQSGFRLRLLGIGHGATPSTLAMRKAGQPFKTDRASGAADMVNLL